MQWQWWQQRTLTFPRPLHWIAELFQVLNGLLHFGPFSDGSELLVSHCVQFAIYIADKVICIHSYLDFGIEVRYLDIQVCPTCLMWWDTFQFAQFKYVDKILGKLRSITCTLTWPLPFLTVKSHLEWAIILATKHFQCFPERTELSNGSYGGNSKASFGKKNPVKSIGPSQS